jgi:hypothetical protein
MVIAGLIVVTGFLSKFVIPTDVERARVLVSARVGRRDLLFLFMVYGIHETVTAGLARSDDKMKTPPRMAAFIIEINSVIDSWPTGLLRALP